MSLLDDVSIVVTPNGYKAGELYAVVPVPTEGAELVTNGDFATDTDWTKGTGWTISGGKAIYTGTANASLSQTNILISGKFYKLQYEVISSSLDGNFKISGVTESAQSPLSQSIGTHTIYFTANGSSPTSMDLRVVFNTTGTLEIDNVSVKEYTAADMDVTRATAATRVDEAGLVNYAEIIGSEEVTNGDFADATGWTISGAWSLGTNKVIFSDTTNGDIRTSSAIFTATKTYQIKLTVADLTGANTAFFAIGDGSASNLVGYDNYANGDYTFNAIAPNGSELRIFSTTSSGSSYSITNISVKEVTRDNVPRIDYTGGGCPHILAEPQRTNLLTYSEDFSNAIYIKDSTVSVGTTNNVSPSGESNATKIDVTASGRIYSNVTTDTYVSSIFIKAGTFAYFKLAGVQVDLVAETNANGTIESLGNGWFKVGVNYTGNRPFQIQAYPDGSYATHTTSGNYFIWGAQIEAGSYGTSYIPTSGSTVTRNQDQFTRDGIGSLINSTEGVLFVEFKTLTETGVFRQFNLSKDNSNRIYITKRGDSGNLEFRMENPSGNLNFSFSENTTNDFVKVAFRYGLNNFAVFIDGVNKNVTATGNVFSSGTLNTLEFDSPLGQPFFGKVKQLQVFKTALTDPELATLTTI